AFYRCAMASVVLLPLGLARHREEYGRLSKRQWQLALASGVVLSAHFATWISSLSFTTVAASAVLVQTLPLWVAAFGRFVGERPARRSRNRSGRRSSRGRSWARPPGPRPWSVGRSSSPGSISRSPPRRERPTWWRSSSLAHHAGPAALRHGRRLRGARARGAAARDLRVRGRWGGR